MLAVTARVLRAGAVCQGAGARRQVALTFDDGPHPTWTPQLLDCLDALNIKATFFVVGQAVANHPALVRETQRRGHEIGTHLYQHYRPRQFTAVAFRMEIERSLSQLSDVLAQPVQWLRFPYGDARGLGAKQLRADFGVTPVYWTLSALDTRARNPDVIVRQLRAGLRPGAIVLMHDCLFDADRGLPARYNPDRRVLLAALPQLGELLAKRKLTAVTLSTLLNVDVTLPMPTAAARSP